MSLDNDFTESSPPARTGSESGRSPGRRSAPAIDIVSGTLPDRQLDGSQLNTTTGFGNGPFPEHPPHELENGNPPPSDAAHQDRATKASPDDSRMKALHRKQQNTRASGAADSTSTGINNADATVTAIDAGQTTTLLSNIEHTNSDDDAWMDAISDPPSDDEIPAERRVILADQNMNRFKLPIVDENAMDSWNRDVTPSNNIRCDHTTFAASASSKGSSFHPCACDNIPDMAAFEADLKGYGNGNIRSGNYKQEMANWLRNMLAPRDPTEANNNASMSDPSSPRNTQNRKRKAASLPPLPPTSSPKKPRMSCSDVDIASTSSRKRDSGKEHEDTPPKKMAHLMSSTRISPSTLNGSAPVVSPVHARKRVAVRDHEDATPKKKLNDTSISLSSLLEDSQLYSPETETAKSSSRRRRSSTISDDVSPSKRFLSSTPIHPLSSLPSFDLSSIGSSLTASRCSTPASNPNTSSSDDVLPLTDASTDEHPSSVSQLTSTNSSAAESSLNTDVSILNEPDIHTAREPSPVPIPPIAPVPMVHVAAPPLVPVPVVLQGPALLLQNKQALKLRIDTSLNKIMNDLNDISKDGFNRAKEVLDLVCKLQRQRSTLRRLAKELGNVSTNKEYETVDNGFIKVNKRLTDTLDQISRFKPKQKRNID